VSELKEVACNAFGVDKDQTKMLDYYKQSKYGSLEDSSEKTLSEANLLDAQDIKLKPNDVSVPCCVLCLLCYASRMCALRVSKKIWIWENVRTANLIYALNINQAETKRGDYAMPCFVSAFLCHEDEYTLCVFGHGKLWTA
jgi:hypothetical protein